MWPLSEIASGIAEGLGAVDRALSEEQAVLGLDAMGEIALHPGLADALDRLGFGVLREVLYPGEHAREVRRSERARCDLVLLPEAGQTLRDPAAEQAILNASEGTLFAPVAHRIQEEAGAGVVDAGEAFWLEVKSVGQHAFSDGVPRQNRAYSDQIIHGVRQDIIKLASDPSIWHAASLLLLFTETEEIANHDLAAAAHTMLSDDVPIGAPEVSGLPIDDRAGNAWCGVGIFPVRIGS
ncbi:MAG: hypothetical protein AAGA55_02935 [Planctomycetota bacterium]